MRAVGFALQALGCVAVVIGVALVLDTGAALIVAGLLAALLGAIFEREA